MLILILSIFVANIRYLVIPCQMALIKLIFMNKAMTSLSYGRVFCLESQKIDDTEYLRESTDLAILFLLLNLEF